MRNRFLSVILPLTLIACGHRYVDSTQGKNNDQIEREVTQEEGMEDNNTMDFYYVYASCILDYLTTDLDGDISIERRKATEQEIKLFGVEEIQIGTLRLEDWLINGWPIRSRSPYRSRTPSKAENHCNRLLMPSSSPNIYLREGLTQNAIV
ncbi:hypothetical protein HYT24_02610 [Candidatus Pacearchaeota archaeon]|nr:hypothetical protein [Candidatus Pacearchaeota archaeon]